MYTYQSTCIFKDLNACQQVDMWAVRINKSVTSGSNLTARENEIELLTTILAYWSHNTRGGFLYLHYADDVALVAKMLQGVLRLSLSVTSEESMPLGLHISWSKTTIQQIGEPRYSWTH